MNPKHLIALACSCLFILASDVIWAQSFQNVASQYGISASYVSTDNFGAGVSFFDINDDGLDDLTFAMGQSGIRCFLNQDGTFQEINLNLPVLNDVRQAVWFDYNNDGNYDLLVSSFNAPYKLFRNEGDFQFTDVSFAAGLNHNFAPHCGLAVSDFNKDGYLDFYVSLYSSMGIGETLANFNQLYKNNGDGTFTNVTLETGAGGGISATYDSVWMDYNNDGWPDLYVSNDRQIYNSALFHNNGDGTFTDVAEQTGTEFAGQFPMTTTVGDYDNDGDLDIYLTNLGNQYYTELLSNNGDGTFTPKGEDAGVQNNLFSWGALWIDHNNNGLQDLYVATSPIDGTATVYKDVFYEQDEIGEFSDQTGLFQEMPVRRTYSVARGDLNNDGYPDIATHSIAPYSPIIWENNGGTNNFVKVTLQGTVSNPMAIGSWIRVFANGSQYSQYTVCGDNYLSQSSQHYVFGLGTADVIDSIQVVYLSGHSDWYYDLAVNEHYYFSEGDTYNVSVSYTDLAFCVGEGVWLDAGEHLSYNWNNGYDERFLYVEEPGMYSVQVVNEYGISAWSDTLVVSQYPDPFVVADVQHPLCAGDENAWVLLENLAGIPADSVFWNDQPGEELLLNIGADNFSYLFVDLNGCSDSGWVAVTDPAVLSALLFTTPETTANDGSILLVVNGGTPPYQIFLDGIEAGLTIEGLSAGTYELLVRDDHNCDLVLEADIALATSIDEGRSMSNPVYPNPVRNELFLPEGQTFVSFQIFDLVGNVVFSKSGLFNDNIDVESLSTGTYLLILKDHNEVEWTWRLVKK